MVTCQHVDCEGIEAQLVEEMKHNPDAEVSSSVLQRNGTSFSVGDADEEGNIAVPLEDKPYFL